MMINSNNSINFGATFTPETITCLKRRGIIRGIDRFIDTKVKKIAKYGDPDSKYNTITLGIYPNGKEAFYLSDGVTKGRSWRLTREFAPIDVLKGFMSIKEYDVKVGQHSLERIERLNLDA